MRTGAFSKYLAAGMTRMGLFSFYISGPVSDFQLLPFVLGSFSAFDARQKSDSHLVDCRSLFCSFFFFSLGFCMPRSTPLCSPFSVTSGTVRGTLSLLAHHLHFVFASLLHLCVGLILCTSLVFFLVSSLVEYRVVIEPWIYGARNDSV